MRVGCLETILGNLGDVSTWSGDVSRTTRCTLSGLFRFAQIVFVEDAHLQSEPLSHRHDSRSTVMKIVLVAGKKRGLFSWKERE